MQSKLGHDRRVPPRALAISFFAFLVPFAGYLYFPVGASMHAPLLWVLAIVPAFLLAYHRGWSGVATALALAMTTLALAHIVSAGLRAGTADWQLAGVIAATLGVIGVAIGWLSSRLHRDRQLAELLALTDPLTGLPNRRHLDLFLSTEFAAARRGRSMTIALLDLDNFKDYNDRHGHAGGDTVLKEFAGVLATTTRRMNISGRFGGEEFLAILSGTDHDGALVFVKRVRNALAQLNLSGGPVTVSVGVAGYEDGMASPQALVDAADHALYMAKSNGRNRVEVYAGEAAVPA